MKEFSEYEKIIRETAIYPNRGNNYVYPVLGLCGEAGEVAEKIKKIIRDSKGIVSPENKIEIAKELGDVLWYITALAEELELTLEEIAERNVTKLLDRRARKKLSGSGDNR